MSAKFVRGVVKIINGKLGAPHAPATDDVVSYGWVEKGNRTPFEKVWFVYDVLGRLNQIAEGMCAHGTERLLLLGVCLMQRLERWDPTWDTIPSVLMVCCVLASKVVDDHPIHIPYLTQLMHLKDASCLVQQERTIARVLDYRLFVPADELGAMCSVVNVTL